MSLLASESKDNLPILIVDKTGQLGSYLAKKLSESSTVVFASRKQPDASENIIYIPFVKKIPKIPDNIYSHIFVIDDGEDITSEFVSSFFKKAQEDHAVFSFVTNLERKKIASNALDYKRSKVLYIGDVFPHINFFSKSYINGFLNSARTRGRIGVPQDGMALSFPIHRSDAIESILGASLGTSREKIYYIFPKEGFTLLNIAHTIQRIDPDVKIDFIDDEPVKSFEEAAQNSEGKFLLEGSYLLEEKIRSLQVEQNIEGILDKTVNQKIDFFSLSNLKLFLFSFLFFIFLPLLTTLTFLYLGFSLLNDKSNSLENSKQKIVLARKSFLLADSFSKPLLYETAFLNSNLSLKINSLVEKGKTESEELSGYYDSLDLFYQGKPNEGVSHVKDFLVFSQGDKLKIFDADLSNFISQTINVWPQILSVDSKKTYLMLFQNDRVLRGSGGTIDFFGLLTMQNGKIIDFKIFSSNDLDKNLKGHVEPPFALRRYSSLLNFHLTDAGFDSDFKEVAKMSSFFVDLETSTKVDGVFRISTNALKKITGTDDPISVKKTLEGKNLAKLLLTKEFTSSLFKKDILLYFNDQSINDVFSPKVEAKQINDTIGLFETDIDSPVLIDKKINQKVQISDNGEISSLVSLDLTNSQSLDSKKYLRFIVPQGAVLKKIKIDGEDKDFADAVVDPSIYEAKDFKKPSPLEIEKSSQGSKELFGLLTIIPKGKTQTIELTFSAPQVSLSNLSQFSYGLHFIKQPGAEPYSFNFSISFPSSFKIYSEPSVPKITDKDFDLTFSFTK